MTGALTHILIVEDEPVFAEVLREIVLAEGNGRYAASVVGSLAGAKSRLADGGCDLVLLDLTLPDWQGVATYQEIHRTVPHLPVIVLSGLSDEAIALQTLRAGAQDYLMKDQFDGRLLGRSIRYALERKAIELRLRESEEFFRLISENVTDLISVVDANGKRVYNSPSYETVLGRREKLAGTSAFEEIHPEDRDTIRGVFNAVIASGRGCRAEYRFVRSDGTVRHVESQSSVIRDGAGAAQKVVVVSRDVTDRIKTENELRQALAEVQQAHEQLKVTQKQLVQSEKLEAINTFAAGVAHEVRNPLQTVILGIDYLTDYPATNDENAPELLQRMREAVNRANAIIRGLVEFSSHRKGAVSDQDLSELVQESLHAVESELAVKTIRVRLELAENLPPVRLDRRAMKHILVNLLVTEIQASSPGTELFVKTSVGTEGHPALPGDFPAGQRSAAVIIEIQTCREQPEESRGGAAGDGVALSSGDEFGITVSRKIIELYGGKVDWQRKRNGTKFTMAFNA